MSEVRRCCKVYRIEDLRRIRDARNNQSLKTVKERLLEAERRLLEVMHRELWKEDERPKR